MEKSINFKNIHGNVTVTIIDGSGNTVVNSVGEFQQKVWSTCGLRLLNKEYFKDRDPSNDFKEWLEKGRSFSLISIYNEKEYRRENLLDDIKENLKKNNRIILLGESGTSKGTLLMEIMCDYVKRNENYQVLYNINPEDGSIKDLGT